MIFKTRRGSKYRNVRVERCGQIFDSIAEADFFLELELQRKGGAVADIERQPKVYLTAARILYKPDFFVMRADGPAWIDVKGAPTAVWRLKRKLWVHYGPGPLEVWRRAGRSFECVEIVRPTGAGPR